MLVLDGVLVLAPSTLYDHYRSRQSGNKLDKFRHVLSGFIAPMCMNVPGYPLTAY